MNYELTSLKGCPQTIGGDFACSYNKLTSLKGAPRKVDGNFNYVSNPEFLQNVTTYVLKMLYDEIQKGVSWELALAIHMKDIPKDEWER